MSIGANIKRRRFELRMTQQELADAMGYRTRSTIAKIESGENDVSQKKLQAFAAVLDTTAEALISGYSPASVAPALHKAGQRNIAVILAGGKSGRNRQNIPSQFLNIRGKPILAYCMEVYQSHPAIDDIYIVCLKGWERIVENYAQQYSITKLRGLVPAGKSGILSFKNALDYLKKHCHPNDLIFIQESTRPLVSADTISKLLQACSQTGSATVCHSMNEYVQFNLSSGKPRYVDRNQMIALQSPEVHRFSLMAEVFEKAARQKHPLTESCCTMLLYHLGYDINFIEGGFNNIKLVREEDIAAFSALIKA